MVISVCLKKVHHAAVNTYVSDGIRMFSHNLRRDFKGFHPHCGGQLHSLQ
jgi:hypothetical protein